MRLVRVRIRNFRCFKDQTVELNNYTCIVGPNGAGKSAILSAINIFFGVSTRSIPDPVRLQKECFFAGDTSEPVQITLTFSDLSYQAVEALSEYVRGGQLIVNVVAEYDDEVGYADVRQFGIRRGLSDFRRFFELLKDKATVEELKSEHERLREAYADLPLLPRSKADMQRTMQAYEEGKAELHVDIPSRDQFYGFSKGVHRLRPFVSYVYVPAVKDAADEQSASRNTAFGELVRRLVQRSRDFDERLRQIDTTWLQSYNALLAESKNDLAQISGRLTESMKGFFPEVSQVLVDYAALGPNQVRTADPSAEATIADTHFSGPVVQFGHGVQRSYLLAVLQLLADISAAETSASLIIGCEEPELYQHPPQARYLARTLLRLSEAGTQIVLTTHSPAFVTGETFESVRLARRMSEGTKISHLKYDQYAEIISSAKGEEPHSTEAVSVALASRLLSSVSEIYFSRLVVLVEGQEDISLVLSALEHEGVLDEFYRLGGNVVSADGKPGLISPAAILKGLEIPSVLMFDRDSERDSELNKLLFRISNVEPSIVTDEEDFYSPRVISWKKNIQSSLSGSLPDGAWSRALTAVSAKIGPSATKASKNGFVLKLALNLIRNEGNWPDSLTRLAQAIIKYGRSI